MQGIQIYLTENCSLFLFISEMRDSKSALKARAQRNFVNLSATCASVYEETMEHHVRDSFITLNFRLLLATSVCRIKNLAHAPQEKQDKWNIYEKCKKKE